MLARILAVATALLAALVIHQYNQIADLRTALAGAQARAAAEARASLADSMAGQSAEIQRVLSWLNEFYKSRDGLQRPGGLWIDGHPDYTGISTWVFDVYLRHRLRGESEEQARRAIEDVIKQSDEWRGKHRT